MLMVHSWPRCNEWAAAGAKWLDCQQNLGQTQEILIEKSSKKSDAHWMGRNSQNTVAVFPKAHYKVGDFVNVKITDCTSATLIGEAVGYSENN